MGSLNEQQYGYVEALDIYKEVFELNLSGWIHQDQLLRCAASVVANLAEAKGRFRGKPTADTTRFLSIARGSLHEVGAFMDIALLEGRLSEEKHSEFNNRCEDLSKKLFGLCRGRHGTAY